MYTYIYTLTSLCLCMCVNLIVRWHIHTNRLTPAIRSDDNLVKDCQVPGRMQGVDRSSKMLRGYLKTKGSVVILEIQTERFVGG